jgi:hypothetical protein
MFEFFLGVVDRERVKVITSLRWMPTATGFAFGKTGFRK